MSQSLKQDILLPRRFERVVVIAFVIIAVANMILGTIFIDWQDSVLSLPHLLSRGCGVPAVPRIHSRECDLESVRRHDNDKSYH